MIKVLRYVCPYCSAEFDTHDALKSHVLAEQQIEQPEETFIKGMGLGGHGGIALHVDVKNGRIVRIRPLRYDEKYKPDEFNPWKIRARGRVYEPSMKTLPHTYVAAYKKRVYSSNRIKYPLKRVDWDPNGERNPQNRGKSKFKRISWDEAIDIIASEIKRIQARYRPYAILAQCDGHGEGKVVHAAHGCQYELLELIGGCTAQIRNPDSWEGYWWGAKHVWGNMGMGLMLPAANVVKDMAENTEMLLCWGFDPESTPSQYSGQMYSPLIYWFTELGIKQVYICPDLNYGAAVHADKWIPVLPNTDAALQLAIAYTWMTEGTYEKDYVATHTYGYEKFEDYVLGEEDGIPKTPKWASPLCGVPVWTIKALAREWASKTTSISHVFGGPGIRGPYSTEPARLEVLLLAMQAVGKPGRHQWSTGRGGLPLASVMPDVRAWPAKQGRYYSYGLWPPSKQFIPRPLVPEALLNPPISWTGSANQWAPTEDQWDRYTYPIPKEDGGSEIHMIWSDGPCSITCWNGKFIEAYRSPKIEFMLVQHMWLENDCLYADMILPVNTKLEEEDIGIDVDTQYHSLLLEGKCIEPIGESKSDYEAVCEIAKKLGVYEEYTKGRTVKEWIKYGYETSGVQDMVSWEELNEKGYYVIPTKPDWEKEPAGMFKFYEDPEANPLKTPTGKIEFESQGLKEHFPNDKERPPVPHWIEKSESHDESLSSERAKKYPLLIFSNHPRWRHHAQCDDISWLREIPTFKVKGPDGYMYEPLWIHPSDAAKRGIKRGDIVKVYNERGAVLGGAYVTERIMPGAVGVDHGARADPIILGELDRGGAINLTSPTNIISKNATGMVCSGYLVEVERVTMAQMEEWMKQYPEAFKKEYDPASGLRFNAWVEGGM